MGGRRVRDTNGEPVADNTDEEQQLIEGRSYADAVAKGKERKGSSGHGGFYCQEAGQDNKQGG